MILCSMAIEFLLFSKQWIQKILHCLFMEKIDWSEQLRFECLKLKYNRSYYWRSLQKSSILFNVTVVIIFKCSFSLNCSSNILNMQLWMISNVDVFLPFLNSAYAKDWISVGWKKKLVKIWIKLKKNVWVIHILYLRIYPILFFLRNGPNYSGDSTMQPIPRTKVFYKVWFFIEQLRRSLRFSTFNEYRNSSTL